MISPPPVPPLQPALPVAVLTDDDTVISMLGSRAFLALLREASLTVIVATTLSQAQDLQALPLVVTADCAHLTRWLTADRRRVIGVCTALATQEPKDGVKWVHWPTSPDGWIELFMLTAVKSHFASASQILAARKI
jgi:hypothetical protein